MLSVCVYLNGRQIAEATASNTSELADISDYTVEIGENGCPELGIDRLWRLTYVRRHPRRQSVWALVEKIAKAALVDLRHPHPPEDRRP